MFACLRKELQRFLGKRLARPKFTKCLVLLVHWKEFRWILRSLVTIGAWIVMHKVTAKQTECSSHEIFVRMNIFQSWLGIGIEKRILKFVELFVSIAMVYDRILVHSWFLICAQGNNHIWMSSYICITQHNSQFNCILVFFHEQRE